MVEYVQQHCVPTNGVVALRLWLGLQVQRCLFARPRRG